MGTLSERRGRVLASLGALVSLGVASCAGERCLAYDHYVPGSAKVELIDDSNGETICEDIADHPDEAIFHEDVCQFWIPRWFESAETGPPGYRLELDDYVDPIIEFPMKSNSCGELQAPPLMNIRVKPGDDPVPGEDAGSAPEPEPKPEEDAGGAPEDAGTEGGDAALEGGDAALDGGTEAGVALDAASGAEAGASDGGRAGEAGPRDVSADVSAKDGGATDGAPDAPQ